MPKFDLADLDDKKAGHLGKDAAKQQIAEAKTDRIAIKVPAGYACSVKLAAAIHCETIKEYVMAAVDAYNPS